MPRSEPLKVKNGEPISLTPSQQRYPAWRAQALNTTTGRKATRDVRSYAKAKAILEKMKEKYGERDHYDYTVISRNQGYGPPYSKITDRQLLALNENLQWWCPYCRKMREFLWLPRRELKHCPVCGISQDDWHVIRCNPILWDIDNLRGLRE